MSETYGDAASVGDPDDGIVDGHLEIEMTGHPRIDEALERLQRLGQLPLTEHPEEFDAIHGVLRESLANAGRDEVDVESA